MKNKPYPALLRTSYLSKESKNIIPKSRETIPLKEEHQVLSIALKKSFPYGHETCIWNLYILNMSFLSRAKSAEAGKKSPPPPQRGNRAFAGFNPTADDFANSVTEKPAAGCALLIPGSGKPNQVTL
jgi:hypothetical protein